MFVDLIAIFVLIAIWSCLHMWIGWRRYNRANRDAGALPNADAAGALPAGQERGRAPNPSSYIVYYLTAAHKESLRMSGITFAEDTIGGGTEKGVLFDAANLPAVLGALNASVVHTYPSGQQSIQEAILRFAPDNAEADLANAFSIRTEGLNPGFTDEMKVLVRDILLPHVRRNIVVHTQPGIEPPRYDDDFHVYLFSAAAYPPVGTPQINVSARPVWRAPVATHLMTYAPSGQGLPVEDEARGHVIAELVGESCLYVLPDFLADPPPPPPPRRGFFQNLFGFEPRPEPPAPPPLNSPAKLGLLTRVFQRIKDELYVNDHLSDALTELILSGAITGDVNTQAEVVQAEETNQRVVRIVDALVRNILLRVIGPEVMIARGTGLCEHPYDDGRFHIFLGAAPSGGMTADVPRRLVGRAFPASGKTFAFSGRGLPLSDDAGFVFGEYFNRGNLYLYIDPLRFGTKNEILLLAGMLLKARDRYLMGVRSLDNLFTALESEGAIGGENEVPSQLAIVNATTGTNSWNDELVAELIRRTILPVVNTNIGVYDCRGRTKNPLVDGNFHVFLYSSPQGIPFLDVPQALSGTRTNKAFAPSAFGLPLIEGRTGFIAGELLHQNLYFHYDFVGDASEQSLETLARLLARARYELQSFEYLTVADLDARLARQLQGECSAQMGRCALDPDAAQDGALDTGLQQARGAFQAQLAKALQALNYCNGPEETVLEEFGREFDALHRIRKVTGDIEVHPDRLVVKTDVLYCTDPRSGLVHEIGAFNISIPFNPQASVLWINNTRRVGNHNAPHVGSGGTACLGNMGAVFPALIAKRDYAAAVEAAIAFVESVNTSDVWGARISNWPVAPRRR